VLGAAGTTGLNGEEFVRESSDAQHRWLGAMLDSISPLLDAGPSRVEVRSTIFGW
jgi:hypothetical protein